tara:strand:+ start:2227 stop:2337 length:111 start_codon:yes stop_codon:yes gene_type:complete
MSKLPEKITRKLSEKERDHYKKLNEINFSKWDGLVR